VTTRHEEIAAELRSAIDGGTYPVGGRLPSESELAAHYGVSRGTVRQAVAALTAEGRIGSRQGARRVVLGTRRSQSFGSLRSFAQWARAVGRTPSGLVVEQYRAPATEEDRRRLHLQTGARVLHVLRLRGLDGEPVLLERAVYAPWIAPAVEQLPPDCVSVVEALHRSEGVVFAYGEHEIDAVAAGTRDAELLGIRRGGPLLRIRRTTSTPAGRPIEWGDDRYRTGTLSFSVYNTIGATLVGEEG
jgi:GntR family transcriptional regulator